MRKLPDGLHTLHPDDLSAACFVPAAGARLVSYREHDNLGGLLPRTQRSAS